MKEAIYYMYQIENLINGKLYIGVHKTCNIDDGYMGSGVVLRRAQAKYGIENFRKTILEYFSSSEDMLSREAEVVTNELCLNEKYYNIRPGGRGGFSVEEGDIARANMKRRFAGYKGIAEYSKSVRNSQYGTIWVTNGKLNLKLKRGESIPEGFRRGRTVDNPANCPIRKGHKMQSGEENSQFGTMWITNGRVVMKIKKGAPMPEGFSKGMRINAVQ